MGIPINSKFYSNTALLIRIFLNYMKYAYLKINSYKVYKESVILPRKKGVKILINKNKIDVICTR